MSIASKKTIGEIVRFGIVGVIATALHYAIYWLLQMVLLNIFLHLGLSNKMAPIPVFMICIPVNFLLVRYVFSRGGKNKKQEK